MLRIAILTVVFAFPALLNGNSGPSTSEAFQALLEEDWQWRLEQFPENATLLGDHRYNDRLTDWSFPAIEKRKQHDRRMLERIQKLDRGQLSGQNVISYDL